MIKIVNFFSAISHSLQYPLLRISEREKTVLSSLLSNEYIKNKYDRSRRLNEKIEYIRKHLPEIERGGGIVLDLGPGPGEFLEVSRKHGNGIIGIDAPFGQSEMGAEYHNLSFLMCKRQQIPVLYTGCHPLAEKDFLLPFSDNYFGVINSQGSFEQIFCTCLDGIPHRIHKNAHELSWRLNDDTKNLLHKFLKEIHRILEFNGVFAIHMNGSNNIEGFNVFFDEIIKETDFYWLVRHSNFIKLQKKN